MTRDQLIIIAIIIAAAVMFFRGPWRHDMVALGALLACVLTGLLPAGEAFAGFGHPAVITVACVLVLSRGLQSSGAIDALVHRVLPATAGPVATIAALTATEGTTLPDEHETISSWIMRRLGRLPKAGETIRDGDTTITVRRVRRGRVFEGMGVAPPAA